MSEPSLRNFPKVPLPGTITAAEYGTQLISVPSDPNDPVEGDRFCERISSYRKINANNLQPFFQHKIPPVKTTTFKETVIIETDSGVIKGMWDACRDAGWRGLERYLREVEKNSATNLLYGCLMALTSVTDGIQKVKKDAFISLFPHYKLQPAEIIKNSSQVRNWNSSWLKGLDWHPNYSILAFALQDDSIRICEVGQEVVPLLRSHEQKSVSCIRWRPCTVMQMAVGVKSGVVIWELISTNKIKPGACQSRFLSVKGHTPVTCVEYSHSGYLLLSCSSFDMSIYIWDANNWNHSALYRIGGGGVPFASWSPHDDRIISTSPSTIFRIWDRELGWKPKTWKTPQHPIDSACWTPDSATLLFTSGDKIYAVHFAVSQLEKFINDNQTVCVPVFDISECTIPTEDGKLEYKVGGRVRKMELDPSGNRLAICFEDSELIAVFRLQPRSPYYLAPCGFIRGVENDFPLTLTFQKDFTDGALLTIAWNSGRLQYFPFLFAGAEMKNLLHEDYYKLPSVLQTTSSSKPKLNTSNMSGGDDGGNESMMYDESENVFFPNPSTTFRTTSFKNMSESGDFEFVSQSNAAVSPRLFSLESRSPL